MNKDSVREDTGYMRYNLNKADTYAEQPDKIKVEYIHGLMKGKTVTLRRDIAEDLINRGFAVQR